MRRLSTKGKRLLASLLAAGMVAGMMPVSAFADDQVPSSGTNDTVTAVTADSNVGEAGQEDGSTETGEPSGTPELEGTGVSGENSLETDAPEGAETGDGTTETGDTGNGAGGDASTGSDNAGTGSDPSAQSPAPEESGAESTEPDKEEKVTSSESAPVNTLDARDVSTHIATWVNTVPDGINWVDGVTADTFDTAWETVTAEAADGTQYTVEVVPEGAVYFVDSYCGNMTDVESTEPFDVIHTLADSTLLNDRYDQFKTQDTPWGLVETDARTKSASGNEASKDYTGIYGADATGATLTYQFALDAGTYTITSGHHDWWEGQKRSMKATLSTKDGELDAGNIAALDNNQSSTHSFTFTLTEAQTVTYTLTPTGPNAAAVSWVGIAPFVEEEPTEPTLSDALEETDGLTYAEGAVVNDTSNMGKVFVNNTQWNNENKYHASFADTDVFKSKAFTVLFDVNPTTPSGDPNVLTKRAALTIGTVGNKLRVPTWDGQIGYGADTSDGGTSVSYAPVTGYKQNDWNSVAVVYHEDDGKNGAVEVYIGGELAGSVADLGFKFSEMDGISAMLARSVNTSYMQEGTYDNIVVGNYAMSAEAAKAETAKRAEAKDNLPADTAALEDAIQRAEAAIGTEIDADAVPERLSTALAAAKELLASNPLMKDQSKVDEAANELNVALDSAIPGQIVLTKEDLDAANLKDNGLTWKGWGMLNGNSTSNLLLDYKAEHPDEYWEMMEYLFGGEYPLFTHIKMEMGNDGNNSTGAEACTMRYADEEADASRSPGFVMAADAKKINPDVKVSVLRWGMPTWVQQKWDSDRTGAGYEAMYKWYKETIFDAYEKFGYVVDFVNPDRNETDDPDEDFIKWFANKVANETEFPDYFTEDAKQAYNNIRIIASDENKGLLIVPSMRADKDLYDAVDIIGFHYRTNATDDYVKMADVDDKEVWYSEGCATFGYSELQENKTADNQNGYGAGTIGGYQSPLALADSIPNAFMASRRSHYIFQPAIGSFYEGIQYAHKELLSARDPWSGYIHYDPALQMIAHFSRFAVTGWEKTPDDDPDNNTIWRMIASASHGSFGGDSNEHATAGINGDASYLTLADPNGKDFSVVFVNNTQNEKTFRINVEDLPDAAAKSLQTWVTRTDSYMQKGTTVEANDGSWVVTIPAYSIVTATTLNEYQTSEELAMPADGIRTEDRTVLDTDSTGKNANTEDEYLYADNFEYKEEPKMDQYRVGEGTTQVDYLTARGNEPRYMLDSHGAWVVEDGRLAQELNASVSQWNGGDPATIVGDFRWMNYQASVDVQIPEADANVWTGLGVRSQTGMNWNQDGYTLRIFGDGKWEFLRGGSTLGSGNVTADPDGSYSLKVAANGSSITALIDGEPVFTYADSAPFDAGRVKLSSSWNKVYFDNLEVTTIPGTIPYVTSMVDGQDDCVEYAGGWSIPGPGGGSADDWYRTTSTNTADGASFTFNFPVAGTGFAITGVNDGSAKLTVYVDGEEVATDVATTASSRRYETYTLTGLENAKHTVKVVVNSGKLVIDALYTLGEALPASDDIFVSIESDLPETLAAFVDSDPAASLPAQVEVKTGSGEVVTKNITWERSGDYSTPYGTAYVTGTVEGGLTAIDVPLSITIPVEIVPKGTAYFIDTVRGDPASQEGTPAYDAVKALLGDQLLNDKYDQLVGEDGAWGLVDTDTGTRESSSPADKTDTGIYGHDNAAGETLTYELTLPAGTYTLTSAHREWWGMDRPMTAEIKAEDGTVLKSGTINLTGKSGDIIPSYEFTLDKPQKISYTLTATGTQAPVISWLAVAGSDDAVVTVKFDTKGGSAVNDKTVLKGATVSRPADPVKENFTFTGWYSDAELTTLFDFSTPIMDNMTLYAGWVKLDLEIEDLTKVPAELADKYDTVDELKADMKLSAETKLKQSADGIAYYDVTLYLVDENGTKYEVTDENFPDEGLQVTFKYPTDEATGETITGSDHMFTVVHMKDTGDMEIFKDSDILYTADGLTVTVRSLSPFAVAYCDRTAPSEPSDGSDSGNGNTGSGNNGSSQTPAEDTAVNGVSNASTAPSAAVPQTSDPMPVEALAVVALLAAAAVVVLLVLRRKNQHK